MLSQWECSAEKWAESLLLASGQLLARPIQLVSELDDGWIEASAQQNTAPVWSGCDLDGLPAHLNTTGAVQGQPHS